MYKGVLILWNFYLQMACERVELSEALESLSLDQNVGFL